MDDTAAITARTCFWYLHFTSLLTLLSLLSSASSLYNMTDVAALFFIGCCADTAMGVILIAAGLSTHDNSYIGWVSPVFPVLLMANGFTLFFTGWLPTGVTAGMIKIHYLLAIKSVLVLVHLLIVLFLLIGTSTASTDWADYAWQSAYRYRPYEIRSIEEEFQCCGFSSTVDRGFPTETPAACERSEFFGYKIPCAPHVRAAVMHDCAHLSILLSIMIVMQLVTGYFTYMLYRFNNNTELHRPEQIDAVPAVSSCVSVPPERQPGGSDQEIAPLLVPGA
ncbi:hypothetical protein GQ42DRAFT_26874 [Ramicandelaber brevisporus]|nr:hypothetical protein GQ42DRAFT_26874 [Ramicandelaber brevisporus]